MMEKKNVVSYRPVVLTIFLKGYKTPIFKVGKWHLSGT